MRALNRLSAGIVLSLMACNAGFAADATPPGVQVSNGMFVDAKGMTLYTYDNDKDADKSACVDMCLVNWPALPATGDAKMMGSWMPITRPDGSKQWAYKGKPLYTYAKDMKAGDVVGDNRGMVWHIAKP